ncbi:MAG TPA: multiheme c-type cytochrome [Geobacteraceae bacterium]|nr:multiheme c-type cytochrome [Geobacteraceae bacterium]
MIRPFIALAMMHAAVSVATAAPIGDCLPCHRGETPAAVRQWEASAHARAGVGCEKCHGFDHEKIVKGEARVTMMACAPCHKRAYDQHHRSRHGMGLHTGWGCTRGQTGRNPQECSFCHEEGSRAPLTTVQCARFLKQSDEMRGNGCNSCHSVESSCASCHTNHGTDLKIVRDPASCAKCHMGPDHPQWEMWQTSLHGTIFATIGSQSGPTCQTCHMAEGSHDVSVGITKNSGSIPYPPEKAGPSRAAMLTVCSRCHAPSFARRELERDDAILRQSLSVLKEAEGVVWDLFDRGMLDPMPSQRPPHPVSGQTLVTDNQMLYEDTSHIERLLFKMKKYDYARTVKGAYHQNPAYTHWYGNAELKMDLVDIKAEASRLRERGEKQPAGTEKMSPAAERGERLRLLKKKLERGGITLGDYEREKAKVLQELDGATTRKE